MCLENNEIFFFTKKKRKMNEKAWENVLKLTGLGFRFCFNISYQIYEKILLDVSLEKAWHQRRFTSIPDIDL